MIGALATGYKGYQASQGGGPMVSKATSELTSHEQADAQLGSGFFYVPARVNNTMSVILIVSIAAIIIWKAKK